LPLPDKPSIAVLPFKNMSGDPEQEYFADGIVEEIITALSRFRQLFVIARNSSFTYKGRAVDEKQVGRELGVRYVLEGSVRRSGDRVRVTGQLIDAVTGAHLWADRFDGALEDIFDLQDRVTTSVVGAIAPKLEQAEIDRAKRKPPENLDAYDYYLRGMASHYQSWSKDAINEALRLYYKAIELDPDFASAYGAAARCYIERRSSNWMTDRVKETAETERLARRAVELGRDDAQALSGGGFALAQFGHDLDAGAAFIDRALVLNPNLAAAWYYSGFVRVWLGEPDAAIDHIARAMRLSPLDPIMRSFRNATAHAHFCDPLKRPHGQKWYCRRTRILFLHCASPLPAMHSRDARRKRAKCVHDCDRSILHCAFLTSRTGWGRTVDRKISLDSWMGCEKPVYRSDQQVTRPSQVIE
jgi:adenylate cyclase